MGYNDITAMVSLKAAKALLLTSSFLPGHGGIERYLAGLCDQLKPELAVMAPPRRGKELLPTDIQSVNEVAYIHQLLLFHT